jgi:hypothetical protein
MCDSIRLNYISTVGGLYQDVLQNEISTKNHKVAGGLRTYNCRSTVGNQLLTKTLVIKQILVTTQLRFLSVNYVFKFVNRLVLQSSFS